MKRSVPIILLLLSGILSVLFSVIHLSDKAYACKIFDPTESAPAASASEALTGTTEIRVFGTEYSVAYQKSDLSDYTGNPIDQYQIIGNAAFNKTGTSILRIDRASGMPVYVSGVSLFPKIENFGIMTEAERRSKIESVLSDHYDMSVFDQFRIFDYQIEDQYEYVWSVSGINHEMSVCVTYDGSINLFFHQDASPTGQPMILSDDDCYALIRKQLIKAGYLDLFGDETVTVKKRMSSTYRGENVEIFTVTVTDQSGFSDTVSLLISPK